MKQLRAIRILLAALFLAACTACLVFGPQVHPMARAAAGLQIVLSTASVTMGVTLVWLLLTFVFGRVYCSTVCPIGTCSDLFLRLRKRVPKLNKPFRYRERSRLAPHILWIYLVCVILGVSAVCYAVEPWNIARNIASFGNREAVASTWGLLAPGAIAGVIAGIVSAVGLAASSLWRGREFCTRWCPVGTMLGLVQEHSLMHIEIDPDKCISCGKCESACRAQAIKSLSRYVDSSRCIRCFDCVADCPSGAIRYQRNRNRPASPLMGRVKSRT